MEQRAKAAGKASAAAVYRKYINSVKKDENLDEETIEEKKRKLTKKPRLRLVYVIGLSVKERKAARVVGWIAIPAVRIKKQGRKSAVRVVDLAERKDLSIQNVDQPQQLAGER